MVIREKPLTKKLYGYSIFLFSKYLAVFENYKYIQLTAFFFCIVLVLSGNTLRMCQGFENVKTAETPTSVSGVHI